MGGCCADGFSSVHSSMTWNVVSEAAFFNVDRIGGVRAWSRRPLSASLNVTCMGKG